jgi:hypothetical protein
MLSRLEMLSSGTQISGDLSEFLPGVPDSAFWHRFVDRNNIARF